MSTDQPMGILSDQMIIVIYAGLLIFMLWQIFKGIKAKKGLEDPQYKFRPVRQVLTFVLFLLIVLMGIFNIYMGMWPAGIIMLLLGATLWYTGQDPVVIAKNGIYGDAKFYPWGEIRKWGWDKSKGDLVLVTKEHGKAETNTIIRIGLDNMLEVNERIRELKLNKGPKE